MSPVIGMILILVISVLGIVAVTNWGLPAIEEMNQNVALRGSIDEFRDLDASLAKLMSGTTGQTTLKWQPTLTGGSVDVNATAHRWLVAADVASALGVAVRWQEMDDQDNVIIIHPTANIPNFKLRAWTWSGGASTELKVVSTAGSCTAYNPGTQTAVAQTLYLRTNLTSGCAGVNLSNAVVSFAVNQETAGGAVTPLHKAFLVDVGHVHWNSIAGTRGPRHVFSSNAGVYSGPGDGFLVQGEPPIAPPRNFTNATGVDSTSLFMRFLKLNGTTSFSGGSGGQERVAVYLNLDGTWTLGGADNITAAYVYLWTPLKDGLHIALTNQNAGYWFRQEAYNGQDILVHREGSKPFKFSAVYTLVEASA